MFNAYEALLCVRGVSATTAVTAATVATVAARPVAVPQTKD